jgi:hypothetical protein
MENSWLFKLMWVILSRFGMVNKSEAGREMINLPASAHQSYIRHISQIFVFIFKDLTHIFRDAKRFSAQWHGRSSLKSAQISHCAIAFRFARRVLSNWLQGMAER